jgi:two-component system, chemotaxis family, chemotaxis protein CheY
MIDFSTISVLCIDDDPVIRSVVRFALERHGCTDVVQAHGGAAALNSCVTRNFDLIICDFQMSPMTGLDFLLALAKDGLGEGWPVIMLSAETDPATIRRAHELGVCAWVGKPISVQQLMERITAVLRQRIPGGPLQTPELRAMADRHHARLMASLGVTEAAIRGLNIRPRDTAALAQTMRAALEDVREHARTLGFGLLTMLAERARELVLAMVRNPAAAVRNHGHAARALGMMVTAMKRVAHNRMEGDGGEAGLILLSKIDGIVDPVLASLD